MFWASEETNGKQETGTSTTAVGAARFLVKNTFLDDEVTDEREEQVPRRCSSAPAILPVASDSEKDAKDTGAVPRATGRVADVRKPISAPARRSNGAVFDPLRFAESTGRIVRPDRNSRERLRKFLDGLKSSLEEDPHMDLRNVEVPNWFHKDEWLQKTACLEIRQMLSTLNRPVTEAAVLWRSQPLAAMTTMGKRKPHGGNKKAKTAGRRPVCPAVAWGKDGGGHLDLAKSI